MEPARTILLVLTIVGAGVTIYGLSAAYRSAKSEHAEAGRRLARLRELAAAEQVESERIGKRGDEETVVAHAALHAKYEGLFAAEGYTRPSYDTLPYLAQHESQHLLGRVLQETRRDFVIAGIGLVISTVASVWSLYL